MGAIHALAQPAPKGRRDWRCWPRRARTTSRKAQISNYDHEPSRAPSGPVKVSWYGPASSKISYKRRECRGNARGPLPFPSHVVRRHRDKNHLLERLRLPSVCREAESTRDTDTRKNTANADGSWPRASVAQTCARSRASSPTSPTTRDVSSEENTNK